MIIDRLHKVITHRFTILGGAFLIFLIVKLTGGWAFSPGETQEIGERRICFEQKVTL